jgi:hypothetical protein
MDIWSMRLSTAGSTIGSQLPAALRIVTLNAGNAAGKEAGHGTAPGNRIVRY